MAETKKKPNKASFVYNLLMLFLKLAVIASVAFVLFTYIFGILRNQSLNMQPAMQDGDLVLYYRITNTYAADEVIVFEYEDRQLLARIVAVAGDTVDIGEAGLVVNGAAVQKPGVMGETTQFEGGVTFPLKVGAGEVFVLGDNRASATDSRIFGCVRTEDVQGRVIGLFRRRNF